MFKISRSALVGSRRPAARSGDRVDHRRQRPRRGTRRARRSQSATPPRGGRRPDRARRAHARRRHCRRTSGRRSTESEVLAGTGAADAGRVVRRTRHRARSRPTCWRQATVHAVRGAGAARRRRHRPPLSTSRCRSTTIQPVRRTDVRRRPRVAVDHQLPTARHADRSRST